MLRTDIIFGNLAGRSDYGMMAIKILSFWLKKPIFGKE